VHRRASPGTIEGKIWQAMWLMMLQAILCTIDSHLLRLFHTAGGAAAYYVRGLADGD
jgi:hypothetical protein